MTFPLLPGTFVSRGKALSLFLLLLLLSSSPTHAQFFQTSGQDILDPQGNKFLPRGMNLNGWLVPEAYGLHLNRIHNRHFDSKSDIEANIRTLIGEEAAQRFWDKYLENYVVAQDIFDLKQAGFNAIRLPFNYRLLTPQDEPGVWLQEGFALLDKLIFWCKAADIAILLDMHSCPGGQSHEPYADPEYTFWREEEDDGVWKVRGTQMLWEWGAPYFEATGRTPASNQQRMADIWWQIANRYREEPIILGYELMNEPYYYPVTGFTDQSLQEFYYMMVGAVRDADPNHICFIEGNIFAHEIGGLLPPWTDNLVIAFHRLWRPTGYEDGEMQTFINAQQEHNVPFVMTESGENSDPWIYEIKQTFEENNMGWFFWGFKKVGDDVSLHYEIPTTPDYAYVIEHWRDSPDADRDRLERGFMDLAENVKTSNCREQSDWFAAMVDPLFGTEPRPHTYVSLPDRIFGANYDLGNQGIAYSDVRYKNEVYEGYAWNSGWVYRNGGVDVDVTFDDLGDNHIGYHVISMEAGEWLKYTVDVKREGLYAVKARVRNVNATQDAAFSLLASDSKFQSPPALDDSRQNLFMAYVAQEQSMWWDVIPTTALYLQAGQQTITLTVMEGDGGLQLAWMDFEYIGSPTTARFGNCPACRGGAVEYRYSPVLTTWENHRNLARQSGCELASITNILEQNAAEAAMKPYIGYDYDPTNTLKPFEATFAYIGGVMVRASPLTGRYGFEWIDGSGIFEVMRDGTSTPEDLVDENGEEILNPPFHDFVPGDPNGGTMGFPEAYLALSLNENDSTGIGRGEWVDFGGGLNNPALYKCCSCPPDRTVYKFSPIETTWEEHVRLARENGCRMATIKSPEDQQAAEAALAQYKGFPYTTEDDLAGSFAYFGGKLIQSDPVVGDYFFDWSDGSGGFHVYREPHNTWSSSYTNFKDGDPNGGTGSIGEELYLALSLGDNLSEDQPVGKWVDYDNRPSPALYQCCGGDQEQAYGQCTAAL